MNNNLPMIKVSIDVTLLDKNRIKEITRQNGNTAKFVELILIPSKNSQFGEYMVTESRTKQESESGVKLPIIGNGKLVGQQQRPQAPAQMQAPAVATASQPASGDDDVPF